MSTWVRVLSIYGVAFTGAAAVSYWRGKRGLGELALDTVLWGGLAGTSLNAVAFVVLAPDGSVLAVARKNATEGMGRLSGNAVKLLGTIDADKLYADLRENGVVIAEVPENASMINQEEE